GLSGPPDAVRLPDAGVSGCRTPASEFRYLRAGTAVARHPRVMRDLPESDRPRERLRRIGPSTLTDAELLAILVGSGTRARDASMVASSLVARFPDLKRMAGAGIGELADLPGVGLATASRVKAALALAGRLAELPVDTDGKLNSPRAVFARMGPRLAFLDRE